MEISFVLHKHKLKGKITDGDQVTGQTWQEIQSAGRRLSKPE